MKKSVFLRLFFLGSIILLFTAGSAFSEGWFGGWGEGGKFGGFFGNPQPIVQNQLYKDECGSCHWAFLPGLLPKGSWNTLMDGLGDHFGEDASLDIEDENAIRDYLTRNSGRRSWGSRDSIIRITEMPRIRGAHRGIERYIKRNPEIKSFSNCIACHRGADYGSFGDD